MNRKQFGIVIVILIVLGGAGVLFLKNQNSNGGGRDQGIGEKLLGKDFPINDVTTISVKQETNELNLVKKDDSWRVRERNDYPANFQDITELLVKLRDLKIVQAEQIGPSQLGRMELAPPGQGTNSGVVLDLKNKDNKSIKSLTLGKRHLQKPQQKSMMGDEGYPDGRYVMVSTTPSQALLVADPLSNVEPRPEQWLKKDFFHVERPKSVAVGFPEATNSWKLVRDTETGEWRFPETKPGEVLDTNKTAGVTAPFSSTSFSDVLVGSKIAEAGLDKPTTITVETFDDFTYTVKLGKKSSDDYPLMVTATANFPKERVPAKDENPEDKLKADKAWQDRQKQLDDKLKEAKKFENWTFLVPSWNVDPVLKERKDLLVEKKEESKPAEKPVDTGASTNTPPVEVK